MTLVNINAKLDGKCIAPIDLEMKAMPSSKLDEELHMVPHPNLKLEELLSNTKFKSILRF